ncbi:MAG: SAM-dependent methyltransferase, partial [Saprospirales bacterium]
MIKSGTLYLIPCGISDGPLPFLPEHTLECIRSLDIFICERAKTARRFIKEIGHPKPISELTFMEIPKKREYLHLNEDLAPLSNGKNIGLLSEAGSPGIADPGAEICLRAHQMEAEIIPLIGPSSILLALMASGLNG